jgi:3-hydroxypropionyl-CoA synthetase (ADP-forming)
MPELSPEILERIDLVLETARGDGRSSLYEHEVYRVLEAVGCAVPRHLFFGDPSLITKEALAGIGAEIVVKIVSPAIAHKQKLGGVRVVSTQDPLYVQFVCHRMREDVLSRFSKGARPAITGFLLAEFIPHTEALGYEVLIGFRDDPAFGPVLTLSKGGDDAEFFAEHFSPANLFLPPLSNASAGAFTRTLHIRHKFEKMGRPEVMDAMANALSRFGDLAWAYSRFVPARRGLFLSSFEVNPFAFSHDGRFVALDGLAEIAPCPPPGGEVPPVNTEHLDAFFSPQGIAVVGVSADASKYSLGRDVAQLLSDMGRTDVYPINPKGGRVRLGDRDVPLVTGLEETPAPVDLVVYAAPLVSLFDLLPRLSGRSVRALVLIPGLPADLPYAEFRRRLDAELPRGVRVLGPNCMGVFHAPRTDPGRCVEGEGFCGVNTLFIEEQRLEIRWKSESNAVLLTQSGAFSVTAIDRLRASRVFRAIVSFGNRYDVKVCDLLAWFSRREDIEVIGVYLEGLESGEGRQFFSLVSAIRKPVVVYKAGRTEAGAKSAASHTASLSGSYGVFRAACEQAGVILVETAEEHYAALKAFSTLAGKHPRGRRVAGVVNAGFESTIGADELHGLSQAVLGKETAAELRRINRLGLVDVGSPFLDVTPMADDRMYAEFVEALLRDDGVDCVFVAIVPHSATLKTVPETCRDPQGLAALLVSLGRRYPKPMVVSVNAGRHYGDFVTLLEEGGLPVYTDIRSAIQALDRFVEFRLRPQAAGAGGSESGYR